MSQIDLENATPKLRQLDIQSEKNERRFIKLIFGTLGVLLVTVLLGWAGWIFFDHWQEERLIRRASVYMSGGDFKAAALSARRALQMNATNVEATRTLAQLADRTEDPAALDWWRKVTELEPNETEDAFALVRSALRVKDLKTAELTLQGLPPHAKKTATYHAAYGRLAETRNDVNEAEQHWAKANEMAPENTAYQFQLALTRLGSRETMKREKALEVLDKLRGDPKQRAPATRTLLADAMTHHHELERLHTLAEELQGYPEALFTDRLLYLEVLRQTRDPTFAAYLHKLEQDATPNPANLTSLFSWMSNNETAAEAIAFSKTLPAESIKKWPVLPILAAAYDNQKDWSGLEQLTKDADWGTWDFLGHAYLCRALRGQSQRFEAEQAWVVAQKEASRQSQSLLFLARTTAAWGWETETLDLLWILAKSDESRLEALQTLYQYYISRNDTPGLYRTLRRLVDVLPADLMLQNNLAQISLLLGTDSEHAKKIAAEIKAKDPSNGAYVSTYAFSLYRSGDIQGALKAMDQLTPDQLLDPSIATYYGLLLAADGQKQKAREYLQRAAEANLLPEEKALIARAEIAVQ